MAGMTPDITCTRHASWPPRTAGSRMTVRHDKVVTQRCHDAPIDPTVCV